MRSVRLPLPTQPLRQEGGGAGGGPWAAPWALLDGYHPSIFVYDSINPFACTTYLILISMTQVQMICSQ